MIARRELFTAGLALAGCSRNQRAVPMLAFIANQAGGAVAVVDLATLALVRHVHLDADPSLVLTRDDRPAVYAVTPASGTIHEIDPGSLTVVRRAHVNGLSWANFQRDGSALWCLNSGGRQLVRVPVSTLRPDRRISLPDPAVDVDFAPDDSPWAGQCAVSFGPTGEFAFVDTRSARLLRNFQLRSALGKLRFRKDDSFWDAIEEAGL